MFVSYRFPPVAYKEGFWQNYATGGSGEALVAEVDLHDPTYSNLAALNPAGIITYSFPENRPNLGDQYGDLVLDDYDLGRLITTIGGPLARTSCLIGGQPLVLARFWNTTGNAAAVLGVADVGKTVYVSKTDGSHTGKAGYLTISDQSGVSGIVKIGELAMLPVVGSEWGYIQFMRPLPV
jgi:hypothetical protein